MDPLGRCQCGSVSVGEPFAAHIERPELAQTYTKIHLWGLDYSKVLYLDADTLPLFGRTDHRGGSLRLDFPRGKILAAPDLGLPRHLQLGRFRFAAK